SLVLVYGIQNLQLTEKPSVSGALLAGFTLGLNTKQVAAQPFVSLSAFQRQADGRFRRVWYTVCIGPAQASAIAYPFPQVVRSKRLARKLWDAAIPTTEAVCARELKQDQS
ncbi:MAG TPA: hypothetical protein VFN52_04970, partial [Acidiferrobacteraceae bacterium]|nr:hypothetical protein [Acidiferrobacteraceae bacterium]